MNITISKRSKGNYTYFNMDVNGINTIAMVTPYRIVAKDINGSRKRFKLDARFVDVINFMKG